jgi:hypothetical protein
LVESDTDEESDHGEEGDTDDGAATDETAYTEEGSDTDVRGESNITLTKNIMAANYADTLEEYLLKCKVHSKSKMLSITDVKTLT